MSADSEHIFSALKTIKDPELGIDIVTLGLIRATKSDPVGGIDIVMTLTSPFCPYGEELILAVEKALKPLHDEVRVELTFEPAWEPGEEIKLLLGL